MKEVITVSLESPFKKKKKMVCVARCVYQGAKLAMAHSIAEQFTSTKGVFFFICTFKKKNTFIRQPTVTML